MCTISVHFQENLPAENESYKTRHFAVDLKEEIPNNSNIPEAIAQLFRVAKTSVQAQIQQFLGEQAFSQGKAVPALPQYQQPPQQQFQQQQRQAPQQSGSSASDKQIRFIKQLARNKGFSPDAIQNLPFQYFQKEYRDLSSREASTIIDNLNNKR